MLRGGGYNIVINYVDNEEAALEAKQICESYGAEVLTVKADVSSELSVKNMVDKIMERFGRIDVLVNNAGIAIDKEFEERSVDDWKITLNTNLIGPFLTSKYVGDVMDEGSIINVSSTNGINAFFPTSIDYDASKAGLINLTHNLALHYAPNIRVNCIAPGWINTEMNRSLPKDLIDEETDKIYLKRFAEPEEIAKVILFLASDDASFINDEVLKVDGGY